MPLAIAVAAAAGAISVLFSWYYQPFFAEGFQTPLVPVLFGLRGVAFAAWTLAAFAIAALAGMLIRRVVPAIITALAVYGGLALAAGLWLRQHYLTPVHTSSLNLPPRGSSVSGTPRAASSRSPASRSPAPTPLASSTSAFRAPAGNARAVPRPARVHAVDSYQPVTRFWPFQWTEGGWLLALSVLLIAATVWLVRRRAT
jgi:hypothetical protein